jgi:hypothetical protein
MVANKTVKTASPDQISIDRRRALRKAHSGAHGAHHPGDSDAGHASVYRSFEDIDEFKTLVDEVRRQAIR